MPKLRLPILVLVALLTLAGVSFAASTITKTARLLDGRELVVTSSLPAGSTATSLGTDSGYNPSKHAFVHQLHVNGQEVDVLIRIQEKAGAVVVDLVADATITSLSTTVGAMALDPPALGHPSPAKDSVDKQALVAAGGS